MKRELKQGAERCSPSRGGQDQQCVAPPADQRQIACDSQGHTGQDDEAAEAGDVAGNLTQPTRPYRIVRVRWVAQCEKDQSAETKSVTFHDLNGESGEGKQGHGNHGQTG